MKKGLSLIEVCISIAIVAIVLASMVGIFSQGYKYLRKSRVNTAVYNLANQLIEQYSNWATLDRLDSGACATDGIVVNTTVGSPYSPTNQPACVTLAFNTIPLNNVTYTPTLTIADGPTNPTELKQIGVTISWTEGDVTITTFKANY